MTVPPSNAERRAPSSPLRTCEPRHDSIGPVGGMLAARYRRRMCRNITVLRGLEPAATPQEIEAAARQYVRKVSGVQKTSAATEEAFEAAVARITEVTAELLGTLPPRKQPPRTEPPLRRLAHQHSH